MWETKNKTQVTPASVGLGGICQYKLEVDPDKTSKKARQARCKANCTHQHLLLNDHYIGLAVSQARVHGSGGMPFMGNKPHEELMKAVQRAGATARLNIDQRNMVLKSLTHRRQHDIRELIAQQDRAQGVEAAGRREFFKDLRELMDNQIRIFIKFVALLPPKKKDNLNKMVRCRCDEPYTTEWAYYNVCGQTLLLAEIVNQVLAAILWGAQNMDADEVVDANHDKFEYKDAMDKFNEMLLCKGEYDPANTGVDDFLVRKCNDPLVNDKPSTNNALLAIEILQYVHNFLLVGKVNG